MAMRIYKRGKTYWIDYTDASGKRMRESTGITNKEQAEECLAKRKSEATDGKFGIQRPKKVLYNDFVKEFLSHCKSQKKPKTFRFYKMTIKSIGDTFQDLPLSEITPPLIEKYKDKRLKQVSPSTVNRELATLKRLFNLAVEWDKATVNPMKKVKMLKEPDCRLRYLEPEQFSHLMRTIRRPYLKVAVMIAVHTGLRKGEILALTKDRIDLKRRFISVTETRDFDGEINSPKNNRRRAVPINDELLPVLNEWVENLDGENLFNVLDFRQAFNRACKAAGIANFHFHDLRHTFGSQLVMEGVDVVTVREFMGHASINTTMRYTQVSEEHKREAINRLSRKFNNDNKKSDV
ncbi:MAG: tyrosine-type recombinase/integrase [Vulcanimicrobiota bacterium]